MIRWGTTGRQEVLEATLETIAAEVERLQFLPPAVTVIGSVVSLRSKLNWFERRPLFGRRIVVTRARGQAEALAQPLREAGAEVLELPVIKFGPPTERQALVEALTGLGCYDWIVFTSANGVTQFFEHFFKAFTDLRDLGALRIAAVGPATAAKLRALHLNVDAMPEDYLASNISDAIAAQGSLENLRVLLVRAEVANRELPSHLEDRGAIVDDVACYRTVAETHVPAEPLASLHDHGADWITFTSASTVEHFHALCNLPGLLARFPATRLASIGPETTQALAALKLAPAIQAKPHTVEGLAAALIGDGRGA
jgi:uroporphyrinogen III methyltransferase/synthase